MKSGKGSGVGAGVVSSCAEPGVTMKLRTVFSPEGARVTLKGFSLADTLDCGQCFRWEQNPDGSFSGMAEGRALTIRQQGDELLLCGVGEADFPFWRRYFDLDADYGAMIRCFPADETLQRACGQAGGIRLLRQEPWEALCSFIISQNNNIPRIKGIIGRLCEQFGQPVPGGFAFPRPEELADRTVEELAPLRAGFRAKYILDAAEKAASGVLLLARLETAPLEEARQALQTIRGVGPKVAECALLYGFHRLDAFPVDTWIKKVLARYYPGGFPDCGGYEGLAQQFLFHYIRLKDRGL